MAKLPENKIIKELADLLEATQLSEIEIETKGTRIRVARQFSAVAQSAPTPRPSSPPAAVDNAPDNSSERPGAVKSPMVGTVYLAPEPGAKPFVTIGDNVTEGQTVVIIEAMKTINSIAAPHAGKVTDIAVTNEQPVEFDEILVIIE